MNTLAPLHLSLASRAVLEAQQLVPLTTSRVPQLAEVNRSLRSLTGFRMEPVAGLIEPGEFLSRLADGIFLATQYIRHSSRPLYTPEPDVVHELLGHAATLGHPFFADLSRAFGQAARQAMERNDAETVENIGRLYWFTLEYGTVREAGRTQALGAGLLSSHGEIQRFTQAELRPFDPARAAATPYDPTGYQPVLYVAENIAELAQRCTAWLRASAA